VLDTPGSATPGRVQRDSLQFLALASGHPQFHDTLVSLYFNLLQIVVG